MSVYYTDDSVTLHHGDCLDVLRTLPDASVDAVCTDPPYGLEFMGREWDSFRGDVGRGVRVAEERAEEMTPTGAGHSSSAGPYLAARVDSIRSAGLPFQQWCTQWATECLRVLKPGGHLLAFGGSRTWHRLAAGIEDAGFEVRDSIAWLYGSGFPKALDVAKAIDSHLGAERTQVVGSRRAPDATQVRPAFAGGDYNSVSGSPSREYEVTLPASASASASAWQGWATALKPAFEPIVVARKPLAGTVAANVLAHGTGAMNIDGCRIPTDEQWEGRELPDSRDGATWGGVLNSSSSSSSHDLGRWPPNVALDESQAVQLDRQTGTLTSGTMRAGTQRQARAGGTIYGADTRTFVPADTYGDKGGASRFFPVFRYEAKAPTSERPRYWKHACECPHDQPMRPGGTCGDCGAPGVLVVHPTVKPLDLMRWLVRLVTPPGGVVLEPFAGSGTTAEACVIEGFQCIAIERDADYLPLIVSRLTKPIEMVLDLGSVS